MTAGGNFAEQERAYDNAYECSQIHLASLGLFISIHFTHNAHDATNSHSYPFRPPILAANRSHLAPLSLCGRPLCSLTTALSLLSRPHSHSHSKITRTAPTSACVSYSAKWRPLTTGPATANGFVNMHPPATSNCPCIHRQWPSSPLGRAMPSRGKLCYTLCIGESHLGTKPTRDRRLSPNSSVSPSPFSSGDGKIRYTSII